MSSILYPPAVILTGSRSPNLLFLSSEELREFNLLRGEAGSRVNLTPSSSPSHPIQSVGAPPTH